MQNSIRTRIMVGSRILQVKFADCNTDAMTNDEALNNLAMPKLKERENDAPCIAGHCCHSRRI